MVLSASDAMRFATSRRAKGKSIATNAPGMSVARPQGSVGSGFNHLSLARMPGVPATSTPSIQCSRGLSVST